jgi:uncharacterized membrane protein YeaQ/YmgE (transglycosylase-associated protein family)
MLDLARGVVPLRRNPVRAAHGIAGSFVAGFIGSMVNKTSDGRMHPAGFVWSILDAMLLIFIARKLGYV